MTGPTGVMFCRCVCAVLGHHHSVCDEMAVPGATVPLPSAGGVRAVPACRGCHSAVTGRTPARHR